MLQRFFLSFLFIFSFFFLYSNISPSSAQTAPERHVSLRLLPGQTQVAGGERITVGIAQRIDAHWHTYWTNPGDSGTAARLAWKGLEGMEAGAVQWPLPKKLPMGPLVNFGYEEEVVLLQELTLPETLPEGPQTITATLDILVCNEICIPETHEASFTINGAQEPDAVAIESARGRLPMEMGWAATYGEKDGNLVVHIRTDMPGAFSKLGSVELYPEEWGLILNTGDTVAEIKGGTLTLTHPRGERALGDAPLSKIVVVYEDASGTRKGVRLSAAAEGITPQGSAGAEVEAEVGIAKAVLFAFLGGLILNLMPCVFPVLSMKALSLVKLQDKEIRKARIQGIAYTLGILACFALIAGVLIALKSGGMQIGWGFQLQHPAVILFLAYLFFTLGLNLSGYFEIDPRLSNFGSSLTRTNGMKASFFTGVLATLVATPCTAPFMGAAMGYALTQPAYVSLAVFMALGLGLALPYLALTFVPALRHILPRPGAWMETFRQFLAFPMFASACWLVWVLSQQISHMGQFAALLGMLCIVFGLWLLKRRPAKGAARLVVIFAAVAAFAFTAYTFFAVRPVEEPAAIEAAGAEENWEAFSRARLETLLDGDKPVFVNMTAAWCITCKVNEKVALAVSSTKALFSEKEVQYLKGDWTNQNPEITNYLEEYGRSGVPIYVYYGPRGEKAGARPEPVVLPQILTPGIVKDIIDPKGD